MAPVAASSVSTSYATGNEEDRAAHAGSNCRQSRIARDGKLVGGLRRVLCLGIYVIFGIGAGFLGIRLHRTPAGNKHNRIRSIGAEEVARERALFHRHAINRPAGKRVSITHGSAPGQGDGVIAAYALRWERTRAVD